jgi:hypothetical protein
MSERCLVPLLVASSPNTDLNVGMGGANVLELVCTMLGLRVRVKRCSTRGECLGERLPELLGQYDVLGECGCRVERWEKSRSHFLEGMKELGTRSGANALFRVGLSAFCTIVAVAIAH